MFEKLIEAARTCYKSGNPIDECCIEGCPNFDSQPYCLDQILKDCVEALTQSGAELKDKDYLIQQQADEIERLRRDVKKQQEKMFELAKTRELKEMETVKTWCHQRGIAMVDWPIYRSMVACYGREPKRGKWIDTVTAGIEETVCSVCRCSGFHHLKYCPNCGAEMEVQDDKT